MHMSLGRLSSGWETQDVSGKSEWYMMLRFGLWLHVVMLNIGLQGLVAPKDKEILMYSK